MSYKHEHTKKKWGKKKNPVLLSMKLENHVRFVLLYKSVGHTYKKW